MLDNYCPTTSVVDSYCLKMCSGQRSSSILQDEEVTAFGQFITTRNVICSNAILVRRDEMWKAMRKHMDWSAGSSA
jgi:hypothetical protein